MDELVEKPDVLLGVADWLPEGIEAEAVEAIAARGIEVRVLKLPGGPYAGLELYLPTALGLFIAGSFFTGLLSKAGEDAYEALKRGSKALWRKATALDIKAAGTSGKVRNSDYSPAFAIGCEIHGRLRVKLLIARSASEAEVEQAVDAFLKLMRDFHDGRFNSERLAELFPFAPVGGTTLVTYDVTAASIIPVDGLADAALASPLRRDPSDQG